MTFDLTTQQGAADAAAYLISLTGQRIVITCGSGWPVRTRADGVHVWRNPDSFALSVNVKSMPYSFQGTITVRVDTEPEEVPLWRRDLMEMIRRPVRLRPDAEEATNG